MVACTEATYYIDSCIFQQLASEIFAMM